MSSMLRFLRAHRISVSTDDSTSLTRQDTATQRLTDTRGGKSVGTAVDDGVSASKVSPFDRPGLGPWLTDPVLINSFDVIVWMRLDRAVRSMGDFHKLAGWAKEHNKKLMFAEGPGGSVLEFDMSNPLSALIMTVIAFAAEMESQSTRERVQSSHDYLATQPRWACGPAPYGYRTIDRIVDGVVNGKTLEIDPEQAKIVREVVDYILGGESVGSVARLLNTFHVPAPQTGFDYKTRNPMWHATTLNNILRSVKILGQKEAKGQAVFDKQGEPIMLAEPIIDMATFQQLQRALNARSQERTRTKETSPLLGIIFCGVCGKAAWRQPEHRQKDGYLKPGSYNCHGNRREGIKPCKSVRVREVELMRRVSEAFLENIGPLDRPVRTFIPGSDHMAELENVEHALSNLRAESDRGLIRDQNEYLNRLEALTTRQEKLAALPAQPDRWEEMPSGKTWGQWWEEESNVELRRDLLLSAGFKVWLLPGGDSVAYWPGKSGMSLEEFVSSLKP